MPRASPSPSASSLSPSGTPPPIVSASKNKPVKSKRKTTKASDVGKNEGTDLNWAYTPPSDRECITEDGMGAGEFDWDAIKSNDDLELWLIRIPDSVKPKYLQNMTVVIPSSSKSVQVGTLARKHMSYDIWSIGDGDDMPTGGEEIKSISCLLPRKGKKGALYLAPKPIARHLVVSAQAIKPTLARPVIHQNPPRFAHPPEVLKHRYIPSGAVATAMTHEVKAMDVDIHSPKEPQLPLEVAPSPEGQNLMITNARDEAKPSKGRKRKGDLIDAVETPTKTKKSKVA